MGNIGARALLPVTSKIVSSSRVRRSRNASCSPRLRVLSSKLTFLRQLISLPMWLSSFPCENPIWIWKWRIQRAPRQEAYSVAVAQRVLVRVVARIGRTSAFTESRFCRVQWTYAREKSPRRISGVFFDFHTPGEIWNYREALRSKIETYEALMTSLNLITYSQECY